MTISKSSFSCYITEILYNQRILKLENLQQQTSMDKDGRLRTLHPSIRPCGQRTEIWAQTVHLEFGRRAKIIIWRWTNGPIFFTMDRPSDGRIRTLDQDNNFKEDDRTNFWSWTVDLDDWAVYWLHGRIRTTDNKHFHQMTGVYKIIFETSGLQILILDFQSMLL